MKNLVDFINEGKKADKFDPYIKNMGGHFRTGTDEGKKIYKPLVDEARTDALVATYNYLSHEMINFLVEYPNYGIVTTFGDAASKIKKYATERGYKASADHIKDCVKKYLENEPKSNDINWTWNRFLQVRYYYGAVDVRPITTEELRKMLLDMCWDMHDHALPTNEINIKTNELLKS